jgi:hypothetical protein
MIGYKFVLTDWDKANGLGPELLKQAKERAVLIAAQNQNKDLDHATTMFYRGLYAEAQTLIKSLEDSGVSHGNV